MGSQGQDQTDGVPPAIRHWSPAAQLRWFEKYQALFSENRASSQAARFRDGSGQLSSYYIESELHLGSCCDGCMGDTVEECPQEPVDVWRCCCRATRVRQRDN